MNKKVIFPTAVALFVAALFVYLKGGGVHGAYSVQEEFAQEDSTEEQTDSVFILAECFNDENRPETMSLVDFMSHHKKQAERIESFWDQQNPDNSLSSEEKIQAVCEMQEVRIERFRSSPVTPDMVEGNNSQEGLSRFQIDHYYYTLIHASKSQDDKDSLMQELNNFMHVAIPLSDFVYQVAVLEYYDGTIRPIVGTEVASEVFEIQNSLLQSNNKSTKRLTSVEIEQVVRQLEQFIVDPPEEYEDERYQGFIEHQKNTVETLQLVRKAMLNHPPTVEYTYRIMNMIKEIL